MGHYFATYRTESTSLPMSCRSEMAWKPLRAVSRRKSWGPQVSAEGRMKNAEWCGMGKGAGKRFPEQLRVKAPPRFHEALLCGVRVQVQHDFDAQAVAPARGRILGSELAGIRQGRSRAIGLYVFKASIRCRSPT